MSLLGFESTSQSRRLRILFCAALCAVVGGATTVLATASIDQLGSDIDGEAEGDYFGASMSLSSDGTILAVGGTHNDGNGLTAGHVRVFEFSGGSWSQLGSDIDGEAAGDEFGESVSLSSDGTILAVGAVGNDESGMTAGHARVFEFSGGSWSQLGSDIDGEAAYDNFGQSVSLSSDGTILAVGGWGNDGTANGAGHVRVFEFSGGSWSQLGSDIDGEAGYDSFGEAVSLSSDGTILAVGAPDNDGTATNAGHARVFEFSGGSWSQLGADIDGEAETDELGGSVSLSSDGTILAVGAVGNDANGSSAGHVRVFEFSGGSWSQLGSDIDGEAANDRLGTSVALSADGSILAAGASGNDGNGANAGHVRMYQFADGAWTQIGDDIDGEAEADASGFRVSLSSDAETVAIGAIGNDENGSNSGHVRVYSFATVATLNITYDSQGGSAVSDGDATTTSGGSISVLPTDPTRDGYTFAGWFTAASDGTQITAGTAHNQTADFTLYAQWTENPVTTTTEVPVTTTTEVAATTTTDVPSTQLLPATGIRDTSEFLTLATVSGLLGAGVALIVLIRRRVHPA
ncbi:MAG: InlB B-repeat-containing protein [Actinomycetota bacterium]|nr:InlB B-repeat-containing protein [Actinomycetota bacterium]